MKPCSILSTDHTFYRILVMGEDRQLEHELEQFLRSEPEEALFQSESDAIEAATDLLMQIMTEAEYSHYVHPSVQAQQKIYDTLHVPFVYGQHSHEVTIKSRVTDWKVQTDRPKCFHQHEIQVYLTGTVQVFGTRFKKDIESVTVDGKTYTRESGPIEIASTGWMTDGGTGEIRHKRLSVCTRSRPTVIYGSGNHL